GGGGTRTAQRPEDVAGDAADAVAAAMGPPGQVATLILPADVSWGEGAEPAKRDAPASRTAVSEDVVNAVAKVLVSGEPSALLVGGSGTRERGLVAASRVANATGAKLLGETFPARLARGAGRPSLERLGYLAEFMTAQLAGIRHLVLADAKAPVSFFAYPEKPSYLVPEGCDVHVLAARPDDAVRALQHLADAVGAGEPTRQ